MAANLPAETISEFAKDKIRSDSANAHNVCFALLQTLRSHLLQSHVASSSSSYSASDIVNVATPLGAGRSMLFEDGSRRGVSDCHKSPSIRDDSSVSTVLAFSGSALPDIDYSISLLRSAFAVIQNFSAETNPRILIQSADFVLHSIFDEALRIRMMPNHHSHSRLVAVLALMASILKRVHSMYAKFGMSASSSCRAYVLTDLFKITILLSHAANYPTRGSALLWQLTCLLTQFPNLWESEFLSVGKMQIISALCG